MKKYLYIAVAVIVVVVGFAWMNYRYNSIESKLNKAEGNVKAYDKLLSSEKNKSAALQLTVDQLNYFNDSILEKLNETKRELKVKDKNIKTLEYLASEFSKKDTIILEDTIFRNLDYSLDTLVGDAWYSTHLTLKYPSEITIHPRFISEKHVIVHARKETVNPPKKFFLLRWFQKKHYVLDMEVIEKNPYVNNENSRYIEIIK